MSRPGGQSLRVNLLLSLTVTLVFAGTLEAIFRLIERTRPAPPVADYIWNWEQKWQGEFYTIRSEGVGWPRWEEFNGDGLRDRAHAPEKPEGIRRVVFLGDSVTLGAGIKPEQAFPQVLQARFGAEGRPIEVFNAALWGWSTRQQRIAYERLIRRYRPDEVVLGVCLNDIPELQNNLARPPRLLSALHERSALVRGVVNARGREIQNVEQLFADADSPRIAEAVERFFAELRTLRDAVRADGARFGVIVLPFRFQLAPTAPAPLVQERILRFCTAEDIRCLDLLPAIRSMGEAAFLDYDHLSPAGARLVADAVVQADLLAPVPAAAEVLKAAIDDRRRLLELLEGGTTEVRRAAAWALGRRGPLDAKGTAALLQRGADADEAVRAAAAEALGRAAAKGADIDDRLFAALDDGRQAVRWTAARALADRGLTLEALPRLIAALKSEDAYVRGFAAWSLGNFGPAARQAVPALVEALNQEEGYGRAGASAALAKLGDAAVEAVPALMQGLESNDGDRRWKAARTLGRIGPAAAAAIPVLIARLDDPNEHVRLHAARALGRVAEGHGEAIRALQKLKADGDEDVRREVQEALDRLGGR